MRVASVGAVGRASFYDRNSTSKALGNLSTAVGPHGATTRFNYTIPAGRKFIVGSWIAYQNRAGAATTAAFAQAQVNMTPFGGSIQIVGFTDTYGSNVADIQRLMNGGNGTILAAGDNITGLDQDTSTGGTMDFLVSLVGTEFDA